MALLYQDPGRAVCLGFAPYPAAGLRGHRAQDLPRPADPDAGLADPQRRADSGGDANRVADGRQRGHRERSQESRGGYRARAEPFGRFEQAPGLPGHDRAHVNRRRRNGQNRRHAGAHL